MLLIFLSGNRVDKKCQHIFPLSVSLLLWIVHRRQCHQFSHWLCVHYFLLTNHNVLHFIKVKLCDMYSWISTLISVYCSLLGGIEWGGDEGVTFGLMDYFFRSKEICSWRVMRSLLLKTDVAAQFVCVIFQCFSTSIVLGWWQKSLNFSKTLNS